MMTSLADQAQSKNRQKGAASEVLLIFLRLGLTCFGGPIAHIGYFRDEFVIRRRWLDEQAYADLVALCQFLPGPASSQVGFSIGLMRAGYRGGLAAWTGFTLPSAIALLLFAYGAGALGGPLGNGLLHGLKLVAVAIVAQAVWGMARSLVFGGGHVVLPLLREAFVTPGWVGDDSFLAGYGAAQAVPGPLFTFAAYLGAVAKAEPNGIAGAAVGLIGIFLPGMLILVGMLPFWDAFRARRGGQAAMRGVNAAVVGLLGAALYNPVWTTSVKAPADFAVALVGFVLLTAWRAPPLLVVAISAFGEMALAWASP
jgi:chromate transport protein ChrA